MPTELAKAFSGVPLADLFAGFLMVLARVSSTLAFVSIPGVRSGPDIPRILLTLGITVAMCSRWRIPSGIELSVPSIVSSLVYECTLGVLAGVVVSLAIEAYQFAAQMIGLQAGLSYASTIDPTNDSDSGVLLILMQLLTALLFLSSGMDAQLISAMASSFDLLPPGGFALGAGAGVGDATPIPTEPLLAAGVDLVIRMSGLVLVTGLRMALPVVVFLLLLDLSLAMLGRIEQQFQLSGVLFPAKLAGAYLSVAGILQAVPWMVERTMADGKLMLEQFGAR